ncbi:MAG TPA: hypothetical protein VF765_35905 [Polyangiaceae bacterium]
MRWWRLGQLGAMAAAGAVAGCSAAPFAAGDGGGGDEEPADAVAEGGDEGSRDATADAPQADAWMVDGSDDATSALDAHPHPVEAGPPPDCGAGEVGDAGEPTNLACTGLYSDWTSRTVAPDVRAYTPGYVLWSDGAEKERWIQLPPGTQIDTSDMDQWTFPVGTKLWKQFSLGGRLVETRFLWKRAPGAWLYTTYAWSSDAARATELTTGQTGWNGTSYEIPAQWQCQDCHAGRLDFVLGFEAVSLSAPAASGLTMTQLVSQRLVTRPPAAPIVVPGTPTESAALGWLHANCGTTCHNDTSWACVTTLWMRLEVGQLGSVQATDTWNTAVGQPLQLLNDGFVPPWPMLRITPGDPTASAVWYRPSVRDTDPSQPNQMPPIDSHVVPDAGVNLLAAWIASMRPDGG